MIAELKPYNDYKVCENSSLGKVPHHWRIVRIKSVLTESDQRTKDGRGTLLSLSRVRGLIDRTKMTDKAPSARTLIGYKLYSPGQIVMNRMQAWSGMFGSGRIRGLVSPDYAVYSQRSSEHVDFLLARLKTHDLVAEYRIASRGIGTGFNRLYNDRFGPIRISLPPPDEQELIVRFLDWASVRLGKAIAAKRKVIGLLEEQKQAIIHRAVTRGLDDTVPLKHSGQEWIEEYPAHWQLKPNRSLMHIRKELVGAKANEYRVLSLTKRGVIVRDMDAGGKYLSFLDRAQVVRHGDLVFCLFDVDETPRAVGLSKFDGMISPDYTVMECTDPLTASFLECFYIAIDDRKMLRPLYTGLRKRISKPLFRAAKTPIPPESEINAILSYITTATSDLDRSSDCLSRQIKYVQEYRSRLIAEVVTGKLDVRDFARTLPADIAEQAAELASSEHCDDEFSDSDDELADEIAVEPA